MGGAATYAGCTGGFTNRTVGADDTRQVNQNNGNGTYDLKCMSVRMGQTVTINVASRHTLVRAPFPAGESPFPATKQTMFMMPLDVPLGVYAYECGDHTDRPDERGAIQVLARP